MMKKRYIVRLSVEERDRLDGLVNRGREAAYRRRHAQVLLLADEGESGNGLTDCEVAEQVGCSRRTVEQIRERCVCKGLQAALEREPRSRERSRVLDGRGEARLVSLACSKPPEGQSRWTLRMLGDRLVELEIVESISTETVRQALKKNVIKPWQKRMWCIPVAGAAFVCQMEAVLDVYQRTPDPSHPVVCMDETSVQCIKEVRDPIPAQPGHSERYDVEYERNGVAHLLAFYAPFENWRRVDVADNHAAKQWAEGIRRLVQEDYPQAQRITLVMDNLNTHVGASLYKAFPPALAHALLDKLEFVYTPKHGSWLNMAECEFSVLCRQCLDRRLPDITTVTSEIAAWTKTRNQSNKPVDWRFTTDNARVKLKRLYPKL